MSLASKGEVRLVAEITVGSCDWGNCDGATYAERWDKKTGRWLEVCRRHAGQAVLDKEGI